MKSNVTIIVKVIIVFIQWFTNNIVNSHCNQRAIFPTIILINPLNETKKEVIEYIVPNNIKTFILNCSYQQPIDWKFEGVMANTVVSVERGQTYDKFWDWTNPCFYVALIFTSIQKEITGNYKCFNRQNERELKSVTIFSGQIEKDKTFLIMSGKTVIKTTDIGEFTAMFPCAVNDFTAKVLLFKNDTTNGEWTHVSDTQIISFSPAIGFRISLYKVQGLPPWGIYKCEVVNSSAKKDDYLLIHLNPPRETLFNPEDINSRTKILKIPSNSDSSYTFTCTSIFPIVNKILSPEVMQVSSNIIEIMNDTLKYPYQVSTSIAYTGSGTPTNRIGEIQCLKKESNEILHVWKFQWTNPSPIGLELNKKKITATCHSAYPEDITFYYIKCETLTDCQFKSKCLEEDALNTCSIFNTTVSKLKKQTLGETSVIVILPEQSGIIRCHSPDVESTRSYFVEPSGQGISEDIKSFDKDVIGKIEVSSTSLQIGDKIRCECWIVERCFQEGPILIFEWKNDSITEVPTSQKFNLIFKRLQGILYLKSEVQILSTEIKKISCLGLFPDIIGSRRIPEEIVVQDRNFSSQAQAPDVTGTIIGIIVGSILLILFVGVGLFYGLKLWRRRSYESSKDFHKPLTEKDIEEFKNGNEAAIAGSEDTYVIVQNSPYDVKYDIQREHLELDPKKMLGMGAYGMVMKGRISGGEFETQTDVAVKTVKPNAEPEYIKSLLTELKVMIYVGKNKHVVDLVGACTQNLNKKQLYIVLQLCPNGGLETYLRNHRDGFVNQIEKGRWDTSKIEQMYANTELGSLCTADLIRWSHQIASGMDYLASKKVIHGDLATRNVLLDEDLVAKISDFGLARQMYEYTQYMKKQQAPLPWRWMAIESLRDMVFSTESDVWSFGITLWEIMTLAETPYPGLTWSPQFITTLTDGYRMSKPKYAPSELYDIMLDCWREKPKDRTNFSNLKDTFLEILESKFPKEYVKL